MRERILQLLRGWLYALGFLSRIPVPWDWIDREPVNRRTLPSFFIAAGLTLGAVYAVALLAFAVLLPAWPAAVLLAGLIPVVTGAFHEDGFADVADSCGSHDAARRLEIMKDPRVGTFGASAVTFLFLARTATVATLLTRDPLAAAAVVFLAQGWSRWVPLVLLRTMPYVSREGRIAGEFDPPSKRLLVVSLLSLMLISALLMPPGAVVTAGVAALAVVAGLQRFFLRMYGGVTGDCLGAGVIILEIVLLLIACGVMR